MALANLEQEIIATIEEKVPITRPYPNAKRWWTFELSEARKSKQQLNHKFYDHRFNLHHPIHEEFCRTRNDLSRKIHGAKTEHWMAWLEGLNETNVWDTGRLAAGLLSDGGRTRVPTLKRVDSQSGAVLREVSENEGKSQLFFEAFFPPRPANTHVPDLVYPAPKFAFVNVTEERVTHFIQKCHHTRCAQQRPKKLLLRHCAFSYAYLPSDT